MAAIDVEKILALVPGLLEARHSRVWVVYDKNADILYINLKSPAMWMTLSLLRMML